jgi:lipopolysaccharide export LptBFGC system permease protein LptF
VTITTSQHQAAALRQNVTPLVTMAMASLAMFVLLPLRSLRRNGRDALVQLVVLALIFWPLGGCGGASSTPPPPPPAPLVTPSGTYTVNFIVSSAQISRSVALTLIVK